MKQFRLLTLLALLMTAATGAWAQEQSETIATTAKVVEGTHFTISNNGVFADGDGMNGNEGITVTPKNGEFITKVVISCTYQPENVNDGNTSVSSGTKEITNGGGTITVTGVNASTFTFTCSDGGTQFKQFVVYYTAAPTTYKVTMKSGVKDADKWTVKVGEGQAQALPIGGLKGDGSETVTLQYNGRLKVKGVKATSDAAPAANPNAYLKWDATKKELVEAEIPAGATTVTNADAGVNWTAGTYVVEGEVTINGNIYLTGNVDLIIKDGAKLTANRINSPNNDKKNLSIYGQSKMNGELFINTTSFYAIDYLNTLEVHSCKVTAYCTNSGGIFAVETINVYGGLLDAKYTGSDGYGIFLSGGGKMNIYGGEVKAASNGTGTNSYGIMASTYDSAITVTVYGGKLWAESPGKTVFNTAKTTFTKDAGYTSGKIETSDDGSSWTEWTTEGTPSTKYVRVGY